MRDIEVEQISNEWRELRSKFGNMFCKIDGKVESLNAEEKRIEDKRDASYFAGLEEMKETICTLYDMSYKSMYDQFGYSNINTIIRSVSAVDIVNGVKRWKEEQEETEFKPGDEVEVIKDCHLDLGGKYIIMPEDCQPNAKPKIYSIMDLSTFNKTWAYADHLKKTGIVHKSLTIYFRGEENNERNV